MEIERGNDVGMAWIGRETRYSRRKVTRNRERKQDMGGVVCRRRPGDG